MTDRSRTRLDEIVEEAAKNWPQPPGLTFERCAEYLKRTVAERAFRHGVERTSPVLCSACSIYVGRIQPAPAEEKHPSTFYPEHWHDGRHVDPKLCWRCSDRRRGERRKFMARREIGTTLSCQGGWFYVTDNGNTLRRDRRSGEDRRK